ncbi:3846_t:CDS:2, partial [Acaulospora colombiana]
MVLVLLTVTVVCSVCIAELPVPVNALLLLLARPLRLARLLPILRPPSKPPLPLPQERCLGAQTPERSRTILAGCARNLERATFACMARAIMMMDSLTALYPRPTNKVSVSIPPSGWSELALLDAGSMANEINYIKSVVGRFGIKVSTSEIVYAYSQIDNAQTVLDAEEVIHAHPLPYFDPNVTYGSGARNSVFDPVDWVVQHTGGSKKIIFTQTGSSATVASADSAQA